MSHPCDPALKPALLDLSFDGCIRTKNHRHMRTERFFTDPNLPFAELRYSRASTVAFKPHMHQTLSIGAVEEGEVIYSVGGKEARLVPGALAVVNPETRENIGTSIHI